MNMNKPNGRNREVLKDISTSHLQLSSLSQTLSEIEFNKSQSMVNQNSLDKGFSLNEIYPEEPVEKSRKHRRKLSQNIEMLKPEHLFIKNSEKLKSSQRSSFIKSGLSQSKKSVIDSDELNSTRSHTSQSRRISDLEYPKPVVQVPKINIIRAEDVDYCKICEKQVEVIHAYPEDSNLESKIIEFLSFFVVCWEPDWTKKFKIPTCEICRNRI